jgi:hypothetical protein
MESNDQDVMVKERLDEDREGKHDCAEMVTAQRPARKKPDIDKERSQFKQLVLKNPNYFGNLEFSPYKPVKSIQGNTSYEELVCLGLNPSYDRLEAVIHIKKETGYGGDICSTGSLEYVRFYVDLYDDGNWHDVGLSNVRVRDIPGDKPLCYAVKLDFKPVRKLCIVENIVKTRAILSYDVPPPPNSPNFAPVFGNSLTVQVQIRPTFKFLFSDFLKELELAKIPLPDPIGPIIQILDPEKEFQAVEPKALTLLEKKTLYLQKGVPAHRFAFSEAQNLMLTSVADTEIFSAGSLGPLVNMGLSIEEVQGLFDNLQLITDGDTSYEELRCVGIHPESDLLEAVFTVKKSSGYSGSLCTKGSLEYIAFWIDFDDGAGFTYMSTATVNVHDLHSIPEEDLQYAVFLKTNLAKYLAPCQAGPRVVKLRAILSWETPPPPSNPNYVPVWGNREECRIQLRPGKVGGHIPLIEAVGDIGVDDIHPISGLATGDAIISSFSVNQAPFGRVVTIAGRIGDPPDSFSGGAQKFKYKVEVSPASVDDWHPLTNKVKVKYSEWFLGVPQQCEPGEYVCDETLSATDDGDGLGDGWYEYLEDYKGVNQKFLVEDKLASWHTSAAMEGLWKIRITAKDPSTTPPTVYHGFQEIRVRIDNTAPTVSLAITSATYEGTPIPPLACGKYPVGTVLTGTYEVHDPGTTDPVNQHFGHLTLDVIPDGPANGAKVIPPVPYTVSGTRTVRSFPVVPTNGESGTWTLDTGGDATATPPIPPMDPCGYVIRFRACDRTIVDSGYIGLCKPVDIGFCLEPAPVKKV